MTFEVEVNGRLRVVSIEPVGTATAVGGRFLITVHDHQHGGPADAIDRAVRHDVDVRSTDLGVSLLYTSDGRSVDAALTEQTGGTWLVQLPHVDLVVAVDGRRLRRAALDAGRAGGEERVTAPMPGRIVRVLVKPGDEVVARQGVVVIEAMKMENELVARHAGRVAEVAVTEGMSVEAGRLLVRLE